MWSRFLLPMFALFWVVMSLLLWRSEYTGSRLAGIPVDADMVWEKILTSPDSSSLAILHRGRRIGFCHLITSVADSLNASAWTNFPAGMVRNIGRYKLDLSGSVNDLDDGARIRFDGELTLTPSREWDRFRLQIIARPVFVTIASEKNDGMLHLTIDSPESSTDRRFRMSDLSQPEVLFAGLLNPTALATLNALPYPATRVPETSAHAPLQWNAVTDRLMIGHSATQVYRLELKPMEGCEIAILVSRAGEILRVELPDKLTLVNEALSSR